MIKEAIVKIVNKEGKGRDDRRDCRLCGGNAGTCHKGGDRYGIV